jgi:hypothetical protein
LPLKQAEHGALAEGGVHAELQGQAAAERGPQAVDHLAQEGHALLGVVHVPGPILHPQNVPVCATWARAGSSWDLSDDGD